MLMVQQQQMHGLHMSSSSIYDAPTIYVCVSVGCDVLVVLISAHTSTLDCKKFQHDDLILHMLSKWQTVWFLDHRHDVFTAVCPSNRPGSLFCIH